MYVYKHILNGIKKLSCEKRNWVKIALLLIFKTNVKGKIIEKLCSFPKKCGIHFMELDFMESDRNGVTSKDPKI